MEKEREEKIDYLHPKEDQDPAVLKVSSNTDPKVLSQAIIKTYKNHGYVKIKSVGGGAILRSYEAVLIARSKMIQFDVDPIIVPNGFLATMPDGKMRPGALMVLENR